jgi:hypothetical protein
MREPTYHLGYWFCKAQAEDISTTKTNPPFPSPRRLGTPVSALSLEHTMRPEVLDIQASALPALYAFSDTSASIITAGTDQSVLWCGLH